MNLDFRVLVIGAGPTGCTLALLLARQGVPVALVEAHSAPQPHPAACILSTRTMEIFREIGVEPRIRRDCQDISDRGNITWVVSLAGRELGRCSPIADDLPTLRAVSPTHTVQFPQNRLEPILWDRVQQSPGIAFYRQHQCRAVTQHARGVRADLIHGATGDRSTLEAAYLVACDGASSSVRRSLDISMDGPLFLHMVGIHFNADLGYLVDHRRSVLYWVMNRNLLGVLIAHWLPTEWVLFAPYFPPQQRLDEYSRSDVERLIFTAVGTRAVPDLEVRHVADWALGARLAARFRAGRVFLAGDAAHTFPPTGGLGLNTGIQDVHNLAWKLAAVGRSHLRPSLLDSYEAERRPVAQANLAHSTNNFLKMNQLLNCVGLDTSHLGALMAVQRSAWFGRLPRKWQRGIVDGAEKVALRRLARLDDDGRRGERVRARFASLVPGQAPHYRFLGLDLGFSYREGAVIPEPAPPPRAEDPVMGYLPSTYPGSRLPHLQVRRGPTCLSLHDVVDPRGFLLLTHPPGKTAWSEALGALRASFAVPVTCLSIGDNGAADLVDVQGTWGRLSGIDPSGAILVRPDGHVAWRCTRSPADPAGFLGAALRRLGC